MLYDDYVQDYPSLRIYIQRTKDERIPDMSSDEAVFQFIKDTIPTMARGEIRREVQRTLTEMILSGVVSPGQLLPSEGKLALMFGVSKVVLREALRSIEAQGIVDIIHGKGIIVNEPGSKKAQAVLSVMLEHQAETMLELWQTRVVIETGACEIASLEATPEDIEAISKAAAEFTRPDISLELRTAADQAFHRNIIVATKNFTLLTIIDALSDLFTENLEMTLGSAKVSPDIEGHFAILRAIQNKNPEEARAAMIKHLQRAREDIFLVTGKNWQMPSNAKRRD
jgi:GntR family transcriptional regulator, transcriptional repressor for pyruvate dehydrogenase complex